MQAASRGPAMFLPSEICRLVLGFLQDQNCQKAYRQFLSESAGLLEIRNLINEGVDLKLTILGFSLTDILQDYGRLRLQDLNRVVRAPASLPAGKAQRRRQKVARLPCTDNVSPSTSADLQQLQRENEALRKKHLCKVCLDADMEVIFNPCRHYVCCTKCSTNLSTCPVCKNPIHSLDTVYMA